MKDSIQKNIVAVYFSSLIPAVLTYLFWILASNYTNSETIGIVTAVASFSMILGVLSNFDVGVGMKRFLGKSFAERNYARIKQIVSISTVFVLLTSVGILIISINPFFDILGFIGIEKKFIPMIITIVIGNALQHIFRGSLISTLKSKSMVIPSIVSSFTRFPIFFILFALAYDPIMNVAVSYSLFYAMISIILFTVILNDFRRVSAPYFKDSKNKLGLVIRGSLPRWIPQILSVVGSQLGILFIFSIKGPFEAGLYYIPFAIFNVLFLVTAAVNQVSYPVLSGIVELEKQKHFIRRTLKLAFLGTLPFSAIMFFYAGSILSIFGKEFSAASDVLFILLASFPIAIITEGVYYLFYARGEYRTILFLGLSGNVPRIILYFILVPLYGISGGALAFVIGTIIQTILTIIFVEKIKIRLQYPTFVIVSIIPFALGFLFKYSEIGLIGALPIFVFSFLLYLRLGILKEKDLSDILKTLFPSKGSDIKIDKFIQRLKRFNLM